MKCSKCGNILENGSTICRICGAKQKISYEEKSRSFPFNSIIAGLLVLPILLGAVSLAFFFIGTREVRFERALRKAAGDMNIVASYYDNFNADGGKEMFAVLGESDDGRNFTDGQLWFVTDRTECVKVDSFIYTDGILNGVLEQNGEKYISVENTQDSTGFSCIFGVEYDGTYKEPKASGMYKNVHQKDDKVINSLREVINIETGEIEYDANGKKVDPNSSKEAADDPHELSQERIDELSEALCWAYTDFDCEKCSAYNALTQILFAPVGGIYEQYFQDVEETITYGVKQIKVPQESVDSVLNEALNIEPDPYLYGNNAYLYEGYYYITVNASSDNGESLKFIKSEQLENGRLLLTMSPPDGVAENQKIEITAKITDKSQWSYFKVERKEDESKTRDKNGKPKDCFSYDGHDYYAFDDELLTWAEAKEKCEKMKGHLVTITSYEEQLALNEHLKTLSRDDFWIGLTNLTPEGTWQWVTDEEFDYDNWANGQPAKKNKNENYAILCNSRKSSSVGIIYRYSWKSNAVFDSAPFICEWDNEDNNESSNVYEATTQSGSVTIR